MSSTTTTTEPPGDVTYGHDTGVVEFYVKDFSGNWQGTGSIQGSGDGEYLEIADGEYMEMIEAHYLGFSASLARVSLGKYVSSSGPGLTVRYKNEATKAACEGAGWTLYATDFTSLGWVMVRLENNV